MVRLEMIANRSVEGDFFDLLQKRGLGEVHYTKVPVVFGVGDSGPRHGDHVWPEENFLLLIYCEEEIADRVTDVVRELKREFTDEGIKLFRVAVIEGC